MKTASFARSNGHVPSDARSVGWLPLTQTRTTLGLWWLATKRNGGLLLLPVIVGQMWWLVRELQADRAVILWEPTTLAIGYTLAVAGPLTAALACWIAGRSRRRGMSDLLATTSLPSGWSVIAEWLGIVFWALTIYLGAAAVALVWTASGVTWGRPLLSPLSVPPVALAICAAAGVLVGSLWPNRIVPPLLAIAVAALIGDPSGVPQLERFKLLAPMVPIESLIDEPLMRVDDRVILPHLLWLTALGVTLLLTLVAWRTRERTAGVLLALSALATVISGSRLVGDDYESWSDPATVNGPLPYAPVCVTTTVTVCVHPAYRQILDETATTITTLAEPLVGIAGAPMRFEQYVGPTGSPSTAVPIHFDGTDSLGWSLVNQVPMEIVADYEAMAAHQGQDSGQLTAAQMVVAVWLTEEYERRTGVDDSARSMDAASTSTESPVPAWMVAEGQMFLDCEPHAEAMQCDVDEEAGPDLQAKIDAATERFLALDPGTRRAWLEANWHDLRAGLLTLEDMP